MRVTKAKEILNALEAANDDLVASADEASARFVLAIRRSQARLLAQMNAMLAESPDLTSATAEARLKWYMDNALTSAKMLKASGYTKAAKDYCARLADIAAQAGLVGRAAAPAFTDVPVEFIKFMQGRTYEHIDFLGTEAIKKLDSTLLEMSIGGYSRASMLSEMRGAISGEYSWGDRTGLYEWHAGTYVRTAAQRQAQLFMNYQAGEYDLDRFMYAGPIDVKTREFCLRLLREGKFYTKAEIEAMDNGQTNDVFTTCGGFNCRHKWVAVSDEIAGAISKAA
jgi:hypothetical protein